MINSELAEVVSNIIIEKGLTQKEAAKIIHCSQTLISRMRRKNLAALSIARILKFINLLNYDVYITISPTKENGKTSIIRHE